MISWITAPFGEVITATFLINFGDEKRLILEKAINDSNAKNILELGVYLGYSTIRILRNLDNFSKLTSIESNKKFAEIATKIKLINEKINGFI